MFDATMTDHLFIQHRLVDHMLSFLTFNYIDDISMDKSEVLSESKSNLLLEYLWCLGNMVGDSLESRHFITEAGFTKALYAIVTTYRTSF